MNAKEKDRYLQIGAIILVGLIVAIGAVIAGYASDNDTAQGTGTLEVTETTYDFGEIPIEGGLVRHRYELKNTGTAPVTVKGMKTSCMCTNAVLEYDGKTSPPFGMHNNPAFYSQEIAPGKSAVIEATFDPMFHGPSGTGHITRMIDVFTDADNFRLSFTGNVIK